MGTKRIDTTPKLFRPEEAESVAAEMGADDPEWTYRAKHDPKGTGFSLVEITDEDGAFVAYLT